MSCNDSHLWRPLKANLQNPDFVAGSEKSLKVVEDEFDTGKTRAGREPDSWDWSSEPELDH